jgi:hypothetical protein
MGGISRRMMVLTNVGNKVRPYLQITKAKKGWNGAQVVDILPRSMRPGVQTPVLPREKKRKVCVCVCV